MATRIAALDGVRGIAILVVLIGHGICPIITSSEIMRYVKFVASLGTYGVDLFFVLSGFLISRILFANHESKKLLKVFWIRRIARIMPLYFCFIAFLYLACALWLPENLPETPLWAYALYFQNFFLASGFASNHFGFDITWSLVVEEHFYLFFPIVIAYTQKKYHPAIVIAICALGLPFRYLLNPWLQQEYNLVNLNFLMITGRLDELGLGALLALVQSRGREINKRIFSPFFSILAWLFLFFATGMKFVDNLMPAIASVLTIGSVVGGDWDRWSKFFELSFLRFFGRISYALYLFHTPLFWFAQNQANGFWSFVLVLMASVLAIYLAWLSTRYFEEPIQNMGRKYKY